MNEFSMITVIAAVVVIEGGYTTQKHTECVAAMATQGYEIEEIQQVCTK